MQVWCVVYYRGSDSSQEWPNLYNWNHHFNEECDRLCTIFVHLQYQFNIGVNIRRELVSQNVSYVTAQDSDTYGRAEATKFKKAALITYATNWNKKKKLTIKLRAQVLYEQIVNEAQPSWLSLVENEGE